MDTAYLCLSRQTYTGYSEAHGCFKIFIFSSYYYYLFVLILLLFALSKGPSSSTVLQHEKQIFALTTALHLATLSSYSFYLCCHVTAQ